MFGVEICDCEVGPELLLQVRKPVIVAFGERIGDGPRDLGCIVGWAPVNGAEDAVFGDGLEGFEETEGFEDGAADCQVVKGDLEASILSWIRCTLFAPVGQFHPRQE